MNIVMRIVFGLIGFSIGAAINHFYDGSIQPGCWIGLIIGFFLYVLGDIGDIFDLD